MPWQTKPVFRIDVETLHLAVELAAQRAAKAEIERQFSEQFPGARLDLSSNVTMPGFDNIDLNISSYLVELVGGSVESRDRCSHE